MDSTALSEADDAALVVAISGGQESALAEVYRRHGPAVTGLAKRLLSDSSLAEDVTQEVFVHLWRNCDRFDPSRGRLRTMLLTQTHGKAVDVIRARNARDRREEKSELGTHRHPAEVDAEIMALTEAETVQRALAQLPPEERQAIELAYFGANTYRQVAILLDQPEGTIKSRIRLGLRRLHTILADTDQDPSSTEPPPTGQRAGSAHRPTTTPPSPDSDLKDATWTS